jgi:HAD superfamily hydrolase (TIGR01509 family)
VRAALVLDFDGTVLDTELALYRAWAELWDDHGEQLDVDHWRTIVGVESDFDPWLALEERLGRPLAAAHRERRRRRRDELLHALEPRPGILDWLDEAERLGVPVGIASSSPPDWVDGHLCRLGLRDRFAHLACVDGVIPSKPDPTSYRTACERLGADPRLSVAVEDSPHGVAAAVGAGLLTIAVPHGLTAPLDFGAADLVVGSLEELTLADALDSARRRTTPDR